MFGKTKFTGTLAGQMKDVLTERGFAPHVSSSSEDVALAFWQWGGISYGVMYVLWKVQLKYENICRNDGETHKVTLVDGRWGISTGAIETAHDLRDLLRNEVQHILGEKKESSFRALEESWLWPENKTLSHSQWNKSLERLWYIWFYVGKNADLYLIPDTNPQQILMVRTDRTSVFDIPLDLEVKWKGAIQNQIALQGAQFAREHGIRTTNYPLPDNIPQDLQDRCQAIELCRPLEVNIGTAGSPKTSGVELIFRNYLTWSLLKALKAGKDPYEIGLSTELKEWDSLRNEEWLALFTPTTKDKNDTPVPSEKVRSQCPEIIEALKKLFKEFTDFCYERGYVIVDTKFEVFINSKGEWCLGDEILTPESSRFIKKEDFEAGRYISADKQIIRNLGEEFGWKQKWADLKQNTPDAKLLPVAHEVKAEKQAEVIAGYQGIFEALKK